MSTNEGRMAALDRRRAVLKKLAEFGEVGARIPELMGALGRYDDIHSGRHSDPIRVQRLQEASLRMDLNWLADNLDAERVDARRWRATRVPPEVSHA